MNIKDIDFNTLYIKQKESSSFQAKTKEDWDNKAISFNSRVHKSIYNKELEKFIDFRGCETLLDVGCGVGNLSLSFANRVKKIYALDYSTKMLELLDENAKKRAIKNIESINLSWEESWQSLKKCDLVIASRSMEVKDMKNSLLKLNNFANKRVYLTYKVGGSFIDDSILEIMQRDIVKKPDYIYLVNILYSLGINPTLNYIKSEGRGSIYKDEKSFVDSVKWSLDGITQKEEQRLIEFYKKSKTKLEEANKYQYWALISWEKTKDL